METVDCSWHNCFCLGQFVFVVRFGYMERHDSALLHAIVNHDIEGAKQAFRDGATMEMQIRHHTTFLQAAAYHGDLAIAKILVEHGAGGTLFAKDDNGDTAHDIALKRSHPEMAKYLQSLISANGSN